MTSGILLQASIIPCPEEQPVTTKSTVLLANKIPIRIEISIYEYFSFSLVLVQVIHHTLNRRSLLENLCCQHHLPTAFPLLHHVVTRTLHLAYMLLQIYQASLKIYHHSFHPPFSSLSSSKE